MKMGKLLSNFIFAVSCSILLLYTPAEMCPGKFLLVGFLQKGFDDDAFESSYRAIYEDFPLVQNAPFWNLPGLIKFCSYFLCSIMKRTRKLIKRFVGRVFLFRLIYIFYVKLS